MNDNNLNKKIRPVLPGGFRDYSSEEQSIRKYMLSKISNVFEKFGFFPLETPAVERYEVLTGGDENFDKQIFKLVQNNSDNNDSKIALRFDLTVPLARFVSENMTELKFPFKRYQVGNVWRGERQQAGRFKEFIQCDVDIVGTKRMEADAEVITVVWEAMKALGIEDILISINNRKILDALPEFAEYTNDKNIAVLRVLDKLDKIGWDGIKKELGEEKIKLNNSQIDKIIDLLNIKNDDWKNTLSLMTDKIKGIKTAEDGVNELMQIANNLVSLGVPEKKWKIDFSIARGLSYYTGSVFETTILNSPVGSVASGGRYDGLVEKFSSVSMSAVGVSIGFDRLFSVLGDIKIDYNINFGPEAIVLNFDDELIDDVMSISKELRDDGINTELYLGAEKSLRGQMSYAINRGAKFICIFGKEEKEKKVVQIKNTKTREQKEIEIDKIGEYISSVL